MKNGSKRLPAFIIAPQTITKANYKLLFTQGYLKTSKSVRRRLREVLQVDDEMRWGRLDAAPPPHR